MNKIFKAVILSSSVVLGLFLPNQVRAEIKEEIRRTGVLKVAIRNDSPLFGYGREQIGYCSDFAQRLAANLSENLGKEIRLQLFTSTTQNRWDLVKDEEVYLECGPNTITLERETEYGIKFSRPFFVTASQVFVNKGTTEEDIRNGRMGIVAGTTNEEEIRALYEPQNVDNSFFTRNEGIMAVQEQQITGFASDGILLIGTALDMRIEPNTYNLVTPYVGDRPFCAAYGMILPGGEEEEEWRNTVNTLLAGEAGQQIWQTWFQELLPYIGTVLQECQE